MVRTRSNISTTPSRTAGRRSLSENEVVILEPPRPPNNNGQVISADAESSDAPLVSKSLEVQPIQIFVRNQEEGRTIAISGVKPSDTVESVKAKIQNEEGIPSELQRLAFACEGIDLELQKLVFDSLPSLEDDRALSYYNIQNESTLLLSLQTLNWSKEVECPKETNDANLEGPNSAARLYAEAQGRKEKMEKNLQCAVCWSLPLCNIYQCKQGHLICMDCYSKMPKPISCPSCRTPMPATPIRNRAAEQVRHIMR